MPRHDVLKNTWYHYREEIPSGEIRKTKRVNLFPVDTQWVAELLDEEEDCILLVEGFGLADVAHDFVTGLFERYGLEGIVIHDDRP